MLLSGELVAVIVRGSGVDVACIGTAGSDSMLTKASSAIGKIAFLCMLISFPFSPFSERRIETLKI
jgi:hypothetical protein